MALDIETEYPGRSVPASPEYPYGSFKNSTTPILRDGTPFDRQWLNDIQGFFQAVLNTSGTLPSGIPDTSLNSDYLNALISITHAGEFRTIYSSATISASESVVFMDCSAGSFDVTLPSPSEFMFGAYSSEITLKRIDNSDNTITVFNVEGEDFIFSPKSKQAVSVASDGVTIHATNELLFPEADLDRSAMLEAKKYVSPAYLKSYDVLNLQNDSASFTLASGLTVQYMQTYTGLRRETVRKWLKPFDNVVLTHLVTLHSNIDASDQCAITMFDVTPTQFTLYWTQLSNGPAMVLGIGY